MSVTGLVFNADLVGAFNILKKVVETITLSLPGRGNWPKARPEGFEEPFSRVALMRTPQTFPSLARG